MHSFFSLNSGHLKFKVVLKLRIMTVNTSPGRGSLGSSVGSAMACFSSGPGLETRGRRKFFQQEAEFYCTAFHYHSPIFLI